MPVGIDRFRGAERGADVYVIGAGASLNHLDPRFFDGKVTVTVNAVARIWGVRPTYIVCKEEHETEARAFPNVPVITSLYAAGTVRGIPVTPGGPNVWLYPHLDNQVSLFDPTRHWPPDPDSLVVSMSTITSAMHFAAYLGAATIILVGHDAGQVGTDGPYVRGYPAAPMAWLLQIETQSRAVKAELARRYGVRVYSLSPFLNYHLEGVPFDGGDVTINLGR